MIFNMDQIGISVVVPTYKRTSLLKRCLASLAGQTLPPGFFEIIVVSDGHDNDTSLAVHAFRASFNNININYLSTDKKAGPAAARNKGWRAAKGALIAFTDDDCIADEQWLEVLLAVHHQHKHICQVFTGRTIVPLTGKPTDFEKNLSHLERAEFITANCACTRSALERVNGFDESFQMAWREDSDLHFKLLRMQIPIGKVNDAIIVHPVKNAKWGISLKEQKKALYNVLLYKKHPGLFRQRIKAQPSFHYYFAVVSLLSAAFAAIMHMNVVALLSLGVWLSITTRFFLERIKGTDHSFRHITEMAVTSALIPVLSVFWTLYGSLKFKKLLL